MASKFKTSDAKASHIRNMYVWEPAPKWNNGTVVLITGAGSGIGRQIARIYAARSARMVLCDISEQALKDTVVECRGLSKWVSKNTPGLAGSVAPAEDGDILTDTSPASKDILGIRTDVTKEEDCQNFINLAVDRFGRIDVLVLCAGIGAHNVFSETKDLGMFRKCIVRVPRPVEVDS